MKKIILYTTLVIIFLLSAHQSFSYELKVKNFNYVASNILEFEIFIKGPAPQLYCMGQYIFNFNPAFANGGTLTYTKRNFSDLPSTKRPLYTAIFNDQLRLSTNLPNADLPPTTISNTGDGTKIIRMRLTTTACSFAGDLNLTWRNVSDGGYYTKVYDAVTEYFDPEEPELGSYYVSITNITNAASHFVDPIPSPNIANVLVNPGCGGFPTLKDAFNAINTNTGGVYTNQNVTVSIVNNTTESSSAVLNEGSFSSCIIRPANNSVSVTAASGVDNLIVYDGADNVTIDGRIGGVGSIQLTILNPNTGSANSIKMFNGASNNIVQNLNIVNSGLNTDANNIYIAGTDAGLAATGNDNNKIENCIIDGGSTAVNVIGSPVFNTGTKINTGTIILNNEIKNFKKFGVNTSWNTKNNRIEGNKIIFGSALYITGEIYLEGIVFAGIGDNYIIRNKIYSTLNPIANTYYFGMFISPAITPLPDNSTTIHIENNFISITDDAAGYIYGMYCGKRGQVVQTTNVQHNTVYIGKTGSIGGFFSTGIGMFDMNVSGSIYNVYNNLLINERYVTSGIPGWAIEVQPTPLVTFNFDYNCYWSIGNFALVNGVNYSGLTAYRTASIPNEQNTILKNANFTDKFAGDLHLAGASIGDFELAGKTGINVPTDIDMDSRNLYFPYKGADESTSLGGITSLNLKCYPEGFYYPVSDQMIKSIPVNVFLKSSVFPYTTVSSSTTTLDVNGNTPSLNFIIPNNGAYYIAVNNWNVLSTWNAVPQNFTVGGTTNFDFSTAVNQAYGNNITQIDASPPRWGIYIGDVNQDEIINNTDVTLIHDASVIYSAGNIVTDLNGDEVVDADDLAIVRNNEANSVHVVKP